MKSQYGQNYPAIIITTIMSTIAKVAFTVLVFKNRYFNRLYIYICAAKLNWNYASTGIAIRHDHEIICWGIQFQ